MEKLKILNVRGQTHVEVILSFIIFISAVIFIFIFLNPLANKEQQLPNIDYIKRIIIENSSSNVGKLPIIFTTGGNCYNFDENNYNGKYIEVQNEDIRKVTVYFSNSFTSNNAPRKNPSCAQQVYTLGLYSEEQILDYIKITRLKQNYESDYNGFRNSKGINNEFSFSFKDLNGVLASDLSVSKEIPERTNVLSLEFPVRVIDQNANIKEYIMDVKAW